VEVRGHHQSWEDVSSFLGCSQAAFLLEKTNQKRKRVIGDKMRRSSYSWGNISEEILTLKIGVKKWGRGEQGGRL